MKTLQLICVCIASAALLSACSGNSGTPSSGFANEPSWVTNPIKGCGVGSAKYRGIRDLTRKAAIASARDDLARQLKVKVEGMIKTYQAMGEAEGKEFSEEQTSRVSRNIVSTTLVGTIPKKNAMVGKDYYSTVCLDPAVFADAFDKMNDMSQKMRSALKKRAKAEFADLDKQLERLDGE